MSDKTSIEKLFEGAPEGTTHWEPASDTVCGSFMRYDGAKWYYWPVGWLEYKLWYFCRVSEKRAKKMIPRPATPSAWDGTGLPPVGTVCEALNQELSSPEWEKCTVLFCGKYRILYDSESCSERVGYIEDTAFRPIRTAEQLAAEERERAIEEMRVAAGSRNNFPFAELYDAGYRKQGPSK